ncbi:MAG: hypothetical protein Kow00106_14320 [Anaerolineae bacterium]
MRETVQNLLPYVTGGLFGLALLLFAIAFRLFQRSRTDTYWRRRREAGQRGWRLFVLASIMVIFSAVTCVSMLAISVLGEDGTASAGRVSATPEATTVAENSAVPVPTATDTPPPQTNSRATTPAPTPLILIVTATPAYTPTPTPFPTYTPNVTQAVSSVTPQPGATLRIVALDDQIDASFRPVNPRTTFVAGVKRLYLFVEFSAMTEGVLWRRVITKDGELFDDNTYLWGLEDSGSSYFFFGHDSGFEPGNYEIRLYIGATDIPVSTASFTVVPSSE